LFSSDAAHKNPNTVPEIMKKEAAVAILVSSFSRNPFAGNSFSLF